MWLTDSVHVKDDMVSIQPEDSCRARQNYDENGVLERHHAADMKVAYKQKYYAT